MWSWFLCTANDDSLMMTWASKGFTLQHVQVSIAGSPPSSAIFCNIIPAATWGQMSNFVLFFSRFDWWKERKGTKLWLWWRVPHLAGNWLLQKLSISVIRVQKLSTNKKWLCSPVQVQAIIWDAFNWSKNYLSVREPLFSPLFKCFVSIWALSK